MKKDVLLFFKSELEDLKTNGPMRSGCRKRRNEVADDIDALEVKVRMLETENRLRYLDELEAV